MDGPGPLELISAAQWSELVEDCDVSEGEGISSGFAGVIIFVFCSTFIYVTCDVV